MGETETMELGTQGSFQCGCKDLAAAISDTACNGPRGALVATFPETLPLLQLVTSLNDPADLITEPLLVRELGMASTKPTERFRVALDLFKITYFGAKLIDFPVEQRGGAFRKRLDFLKDGIAILAKGALDRHKPFTRFLKVERDRRYVFYPLF